MREGLWERNARYPWKAFLGVAALGSGRHRIKRAAERANRQADRERAWQSLDRTRKNPFHRAAVDLRRDPRARRHASPDGVDS